MAKQLRDAGRVVDLGGDKVALDCSEDPPKSSSSADDVVSGFAGSEIWVAVCDGPVPGWEIKERIKLA